MAVVVGHWDLSWNTPIKEAELWALPLRDFEVTDWRMWPVSGISNAEPEVDLTEYASLQDALAGLGHLSWVFMEPRQERLGVLPTSTLVHFHHPENVVYIFGSAHYNPVAAGHPRENDAVVELPTAQNKGLLWPHQVLVAALYDRMVKSSWRS